MISITQRPKLVLILPIDITTTIGAASPVSEPLGNKGIYSFNARRNETHARSLQSARIVGATSVMARKLAAHLIYGLLRFDKFQRPLSTPQ